MVLALAACGRSGVADEPLDAGAVPATSDAGTTAGALTCSDKIRFEEAAGCKNDGAVELCALDDAATAAGLARIAPGLYRVGTPGRLGCTAPQTTYLLPLAPQADWCVVTHGAMTANGWAVLCTLAARDDVTVIGPWWAE